MIRSSNVGDLAGPAGWVDAGIFDYLSMVLLFARQGIRRGFIEWLCFMLCAPNFS